MIGSHVQHLRKSVKMKSVKFCKFHFQ